MRKKGLLLVIAMLLVFGLVACNTTTTTTATTSGTTTNTTTGTTTTTTTTQSTTAFSVTLAGLDDAGFTAEDKIVTGQLFNLLDGVTALGTDSVDYVDDITFLSAPDDCQIDENNNLFSTTPTTCVVTYTVVVNMKITRADRNIKISAAPIVMEFTETDLIDNVALFGTDYVATTTKGAANSWYYWTANAAVLGETGSIAVNGGKLIIDQEDLGGVNYGCQSMNETNVPLTKNQYYKLSMTITSDVDTIIDFVTKAFNNDYANDTHSEMDIKVGTFDYEIVFKAAQDILYFNIMTGVVQALGSNPGKLEFSNFVLWEGPIVYEYDELLNFFDNDTIAVGTAVGPIPTGGTDADFVRSFYYWINDGEIAVEYVEDGIAVEVVTGSSVDYGIQIQYNDMLKAYYTLKTGAHYKLSMNVNATSARTMEVNVTGDHHTKPTSVSKRFDLAVGDNTIVVEFASLYDYFFMKLNFGNYGDLIQTGVFTITNLQLFEEKGAVDPEPEDPSTAIGNLLDGAFENVIDSALAINPAVNPVGETYIWKGIIDWFGGWTAFPDVTGVAKTNGFDINIVNAGAPEFWGIQVKYAGPTIVVGTAYHLYFEVIAENARRINFQIKDAGFGGADVNQDIELLAGKNIVEIDFISAQTTFNFQLNMGHFTDVNETGLYQFSNFVLTRPTQEMVGYIDNGDFATDQAFAATDGDGWAYWSTQGIPDPWALPNYIGTTTIAAGVMTAVTTQTGGAVWANQIQYNHVGSTLVVGAVYRVEFDVNSDIDTTICVQLKNDDNSKNKDVTVAVKAGDNHIILFYTATQTRFKLFVMLGFTAPSTLVFDNFQIFEPIIPEPVVTEEVGSVFGTPSNVAGALPIENVNIGEIFVPAPADTIAIPANTFYLWYGQAATGWFNWTEFPVVTGTYGDGKVNLDITNTGSNEFWGIQLKYFGGPITIDKTYVLSFVVYSSVTRGMKLEIKNAGSAYASLDVVLVPGYNQIELEFVAAYATLIVQFNLGKFSTEYEEEGSLTFEQFFLAKPTALVESYFDNGDFATDQAFVGADAVGWAYWSTQGIPDGWATPNYIGTSTIAAGVLTAITTQPGGAVWGNQMQYNHVDSDMIVGEVYKIEFDVTSDTATSICIELKNQDNGKNKDITVNLSVGINHITVYYTATQAQFRLFVMLGFTAPSTLVFDNFTYYAPVAAPAV